MPGNGYLQGANNERNGRHQTKNWVTPQYIHIPAQKSHQELSSPTYVFIEVFVLPVDWTDRIKTRKLIRRSPPHTR